MTLASSDLSSASTPTRSGAAPDPVRPAPRIVAAPRPGRWIAAAVVAVLLAMAVHGAVTNDNLHWDLVWLFLPTHHVVSGLYLTLWLTAVVTVLGLAIGAVLAVMRLSDNPVLQTVSWAYVWLFRSVPLLVQLLFWFSIGALYPRLSVGVPFGPEFASADARSLISPVVAAVIGLTLHEAAFGAEIIRGGIVSVDPGQAEAASSLGLSRARTYRRILLPQAMRAIVPAAGNLLIGTLKGTAVVSVIAVSDLLLSVQLIYNRIYQIIPLLIVATIWYIVVTSVLSIVQYYVERRYARGSRNLPPTPRQRLLAAVAERRVVRVERAS